MNEMNLSLISVKNPWFQLFIMIVNPFPLIYCRLSHKRHANNAENISYA